MRRPRRAAGAVADPKNGVPLCRIGDIPDGGSAGFVVERDGRRLAFMAVRREGEVFVYVNRCPHRGLPLDFTPGRFLDSGHTHILCANHGALFRIEDGFCVAGPCAGASLRRPEMEVRDGTVYLWN